MSNVFRSERRTASIMTSLTVEAVAGCSFGLRCLHQNCRAQLSWNSTLYKQKRFEKTRSLHRHDAEQTGFGHSPTSILNLDFEKSDSKIASWYQLALLAETCNPPTRREKTEVCVRYTSSVSLAALIAWMVASTIFNSFSSSEFSMTSIRFLHSLPLFFDG